MIYFLYGPDSYRAREKLRELVAKHGAGLEVQKVKAGDFSLEELSSCFGGASLFAKKKFLAVEGIFSKEFKQREEFNKFLQALNFPKDEFLVFLEEEADRRTNLFKNLNKMADEIYEFEALKGSEMEAWMTKKAEALDLKISRHNLLKLAEAVIGDTWLGAMELAKLKAFAGEKEIKAEDLEALVVERFSDKIFELTDAIGAKDKKRAVELLEKQVSGDDSELRLLAMIVRQFRIIIQVKSALEAGGSHDKYSLARSLGLHHFVVQKTMPLAERYSFADLQKIYQKLMEIDLKMKSSPISKAAMLQGFVMSL
jgi:DNA polymerase III subunit delta